RIETQSPSVGLRGCRIRFRTKREIPLEQGHVRIRRSQLSELRDTPPGLVLLTFASVQHDQQCIRGQIIGTRSDGLLRRLARGGCIAESKLRTRSIQPVLWLAFRPLRRTSELG